MVIEDLGVEPKTHRAKNLMSESENSMSAAKTNTKALVLYYGIVEFNVPLDTV